jgi:Lipase (class 3)
MGNQLDNPSHSRCAYRIMLTDLDCANLCQAQYDGDDIFDHVSVNAQGDCYSIKYYSDCTAVVDEGSHDLLNWINNAKFIMKQIPGFAGVDEGFDIGVPETTAAMLPLIPKDKPVFFSGHSRAGPRALLRAARFIKQGYTVFSTVFASPRPGDAALAAILSSATIRSYRNYRSFDDQDFICDVPTPYPFGYVHPVQPILIDVAPQPNDEWGIFARHHLSLYTAALQKP